MILHYFRISGFLQGFPGPMHFARLSRPGNMNSLKLQVYRKEPDAVTCDQRDLWIARHEQAATSQQLPSSPWSKSWLLIPSVTRCGSSQISWNTAITQLLHLTMTTMCLLIVAANSQLSARISKRIRSIQWKVANCAKDDATNEDAAMNEWNRSMKKYSHI